MMSLIAQQQTDLISEDSILAALVINLPLVLLAGYALLFIAALFSILGSALSGGMKLVWVVVAFMAPFLGSLLWFVIGRGDARRRVVIR
ncbi:PLD nuclease N-terminal domain-containing protein [Saccharopolyspora gloriosae]|uniref:PLD nuclease N-terminal domain-containing protein n=1 Tax=Saccharopolyspora gloriosae TaxID=455344 RepID=UPI001FB81D8D|nr:PLD nuclease N-terminal domain-containing protein [Saccharopolyspora gloriosae]